ASRPWSAAATSTAGVAASTVVSGPSAAAIPSRRTRSTGAASARARSTTFTAGPCAPARIAATAERKTLLAGARAASGGRSRASSCSASTTFSVRLDGTLRFHRADRPSHEPAARSAEDLALAEDRHAPEQRLHGPPLERHSLEGGVVLGGV